MGTKFKFLSLLLTAGFLFGFTEIRSIKCDKKIKVDGILNEAIWESTPEYSGMETFAPEIGKPLSDETSFYTTYDDENLYFAMKCKTQDPDKIQATLTKRDNIFNEDYGLVIIDSFNDRQNAYCFMVNPKGVQGDLIMNSNGNGDPSPDFVWNSAARITPEGYVIEMSIPLQSIRFKPGEKVKMGVGFGRQITRSSEKGLFPGLDPEKGSLLSQLTTIEYDNLNFDRSVEVLPSVTNNYKMTNEQGKMVEDFNRSNIGVTAKVGLTPTLTLDGTYNPDFSQIEADAGQVTANLRSNVYYSEKRPFFMEGQEQYNFAGTGGGSAIQTAVHTRNIIDPIGGVKLSGKVGGNNALSTLIVADESPKYSGDSADRNAYFGVFRYKRLLKNSNYIGGMYASRFFDGGYNQVAAFDTKYRFKGKNTLEGNAFYSITKDGESGPFNQTYNTDLEYNYSDKKYYFNIGFHDISKNFDLATGFIPRDGIRTVSSVEARSFYFDWKWLQKIRPSSYNFIQYDKYDQQTEYYANLANSFSFPGNTFFNIYVQTGNESFAGNLYQKQGFGMFFQTQLLKQLEFSISYNDQGTPWYDSNNPFQADVSRIYSQVEFKPTSSFKTAFRVTRALYHKRSSGEKLIDYQIYRNRTTYQINKYLFFRTTVEYNAYEKELMTDVLMSFTYIPGTVVHLGYGSLYDKTEFENGDYVNARNFMEMERGLFVKASYNWRL
ncbi:MAG: DUF5916 domain-containing protein [Fidelibacterota bacterium]